MACQYFADIYTDVVSDIKTVRPWLHSAVSYLCTGGTLIVWRLDRLGWSSVNGCILVEWKSYKLKKNILYRFMNCLPILLIRFEFSGIIYFMFNRRVLF
jgi:DNA invertase Pin-like site-specific DNA recombinase